MDPAPLMREIPPGEPYPIDALGPLTEAAFAVHDISQAPLAIAAQSALSVASLAVQGHADVETLVGYAPCSLWCMTIAESGERKSTCDRLLMLGAREYEQEQERIYKTDFAEWGKEKVIWEATRKRFLAEIASGKEPSKLRMANDALRAMGPEPAPPLQPHLLVQEPTLEATAKLLLAGRPSIGLFSDEAGGFIGGHAMNSDNRLKTIAGFSKLWDGDPLNRARAGDGCATLRGRRLAVHLMAQPVVARPLLADPQASGQGFLARFLVTEPQSAIGTRLRQGHAPESDRAVSAFGARLRGIFEAPLPTLDEDRQVLAPARLHLSDGAKKLLWRFYEAAERAQGPGGSMEMVKPYASKSAEQACRISGVLTLWGDLRATAITAEAMGWGITLAQFYLGEACRLADAGAISDETAKAEILRQWLVDRWPHDDVVTTEMMNLGPNGLRDKEKLKGPLALLVRAGWLAPLPAGTVIRGKPRREAYRIAIPHHAD